MKIWKVIFAVVVIFGAGVVTGGLVANVRAPQRQVSAPPGAPTPWQWRQPRAEFVQKLQRQLELSAGQREQVDKIMQESHERMARVWEPVAPQAREETRKVREQISAILAPEQRVKFEEICMPRRTREGREREMRKERWEKKTNSTERSASESAVKLSP